MICEARSVRSSVSLKISARVWQSSVTSNTLWANLNSFGHIIIQRYFVFVSTVELWTLYIQEVSYMNTFCECILKRTGFTHAHLQYISRKLVNVVKARFTMMYSSRKLYNRKVITTACNFWRQISCSFQVYGRTIHFGAKSTRKLCFEFPTFFHLTNIDVTSCFFRQFFRRSGPKNRNFYLRISRRYLPQLSLNFMVCLFGSYLTHFTRIELK